VPASSALDIIPYFYQYGNMSAKGTVRISPDVTPAAVANYADMLAAMGSEARLQIMRLLLSAHPDGMVVGDIGTELAVPPSTLSHHLDKLRNEDLVHVQRQGTFLRYTANTRALEDLLGFLYAECCTRNKAARPQKIVCCR
jgi:ArsR family transcriptional regulator, arsenate/arsenite/antimonite-responsive transcriptional repressor